MDFRSAAYQAFLRRTLIVILLTSALVHASVFAMPTVPYWASGAGIVLFDIGLACHNADKKMLRRHLTSVWENLLPDALGTICVYFVAGLLLGEGLFLSAGIAVAVAAIVLFVRLVLAREIALHRGMYTHEET